MAPTPKRLGAKKPAAATDFALTTAPNTATGFQAVSTVTACNQHATRADYFRVAVCASGVGAPTTDDYVHFDTLVPAGQTFAITIGITLGQNERVYVRSLNGDVSFVAMGLEQA